MSNIEQGTAELRRGHFDIRYFLFDILRFRKVLTRPIVTVVTVSSVYLDQFVKPKLSDFLLDLRRSLAYKGFAKILDISTGMSAVFANLYTSRSQHISSQKIAQLRLKEDLRG